MQHRFRRQVRLAGRAWIAGALVLVGAGCDAVAPDSSGPGATHGPAGSRGPVDLGRLRVTLEPLATVEGGPLAMAAPRDGSGRLFVATQDGRVWAVDEEGTVAKDLLIDIGRQIRSGGEQGLLGIAVHPSFPADPRIFLDYTDRDGNTVVSSFRLGARDPNRLDPATETRVLAVGQPYGNHNGGALAFGPDGYLYVSLGDGGSGGDPQGNGQRLDTLLGKILRLDVDAPTDGRGYGIPAGNPFAAGGGEPEIWALGLRNPWRMSFDRTTGDLWIGDVGQNAWEEIDVAPAGVAGLNFGWRVMEGSHCYGAETCTRDGLTLPVVDYGRDVGCTVIGGYVYRGARFPWIDGIYLFADYCSGRLLALDPIAAATAPTTVDDGLGRIAGWGEDAAGELYAIALEGTIASVVIAAP